MIHTGPHEHAFGAKPVRRHAWHGRVDAEFARLVAGGAHHPTLRRRRPDDDRLAAQRRIVTLLDRGLERIHVQVEDHAKHRVEESAIVGCTPERMNLLPGWRY